MIPGEAQVFPGGEVPGRPGKAFQEPGMWASVWKLLRMRVQILLNEFRRARLRAKIGMIFAGIGLLFFAAFILFISIVLLDFLRSPDLLRYVGDVSPFLETVPSMIVSGATIGILLISFSMLLQALYLSGDMDFLMSSPLPVRSIFVAKMIQALLPDYGIMCLLALPVLFGLGFSRGYNPLYFVMVLVVLAALTLAAAGLAGLLVMVAVRVFPARRMAEVIGFVAGISIFVFSQSSRFMRFNMSQQQVTDLVALSARFNQPWSPMAWAGRGLISLGKGDWLPGLGLLGLSLALAGGIFYLSLVTAEGMYYNGWSGLQNNRRKAKTRNEVQARPSRPNLLARLLPAPVRAVMVKDLLLYRRDLRSVSKLVTPLILGVVYAASMLQSRGQFPAGRGEAPVWVMDTLQGFMLYGDVALALFVGWLLAANLARLGVSLEGKNYWMIKASPLSPRRFLTAKFLVAYLPTLAICATYVLVLQILKGSCFWSMLVSVLAVGLMLAGINGIYLAFGVVGARFDWENPNQMGRTSGCLGSLVGFISLPVCFSLFIVPILLAALLGLPTQLGQAAGLLLGGAAGIAFAVIPLLLVEKRVATLNEA
jgi:ABC-2 type transport system permease protein